MQRSDIWRWTAILGPPIVLASLAILVSCGDSVTPIPQSTTTVSARPSGASPPAVAERERLSRRNPHDWVGVEHNAVLADFRNELRKPGVLTKDMCSYLLELSDQRLQRRNSRGSRQSNRAAGVAALTNAGMCKSGRAARMTALQEEWSLSLSATTLLSDVQNAVETAVDRYDLAARLHPVLDAAASLEPIENEIVSATVSTAQHSFEYWEFDLPALGEEFWAAYSSCARTFKTAGYSLEEARVHCMENNTALVLAPPLASFRFAAASLPFRAPACGLGGHFKRLVGADAVGAIVGGVKAAVFGPPGVLAGAVAGGSLGSLASFIRSTWEIYWCAMD